MFEGGKTNNGRSVVVMFISIIITFFNIFVLAVISVGIVEGKMASRLMISLASSSDSMPTSLLWGN